jgi:hypothetical protein
MISPDSVSVISLSFLLQMEHAITIAHDLVLLSAGEILLRFNYYHTSINLLDALLLADYNYLLKKALITSELLSPIISTISDHETPVT